MRLLYTLLFILCTASCVRAQVFFGPVARCQQAYVEITILDDGCTAPITVADIDDGSFHSLGQHMWFTLSESVAEVSVFKTVTLTARDFSGRSSSCTATVYAVENIEPYAACVQFLNYKTTDPGDYSDITADMVDAGSFDNCDFGIGLTINDHWFYGRTGFEFRAQDRSGNIGVVWGHLNVSAPNMPHDYEPCTPYGRDQYEYVRSVAISGPSVNYNRLGPSGGGEFYVDRLEMHTNKYYDLTLTPAYPTGVSYPEYWHVYVDLNQDGTLDGPGELIYSGYGAGVQTARVWLPDMGETGVVQLRVLMSYDPITSPCQDNYWGSRFDQAIRLLEPGSPRASLNDQAVAGLNMERQLSAAAPERPEPTVREVVLEGERRSGKQASVALAYPNPATAGGRVRVRGTRVELISLTGRQLGTWTSTQAEEETEVLLPEGLTPGVYLLRIGERTERLVVR